MKLTVVSALAFALSLAPLVSAHDTWLIPDQFNLAPNSSVTLDLTSGMEFPKLDAAPKPERVKSANCRLAGKTFEITTRQPRRIRSSSKRNSRMRASRPSG